jgi:uncharacterized protein (TIGR03545 family)
MMKIFRLKAIIPLGLFLVIFLTIYLFLLDGITRRGIEFVGSQLTGARVDVEEVEIRPLSGRLVVRGVQAADPGALMTNMIEMEELVADLRLAPLLQKKVVVDTVMIRGVRLGTPRNESGALRRKDETAGEPARRVAAWVRNLPIPRFSFEGLGEAVDVSSIETDSLATMRTARAITTAADSFSEAWSAGVRRLEAGAVIDSARTLTRQLGEISLSGLNVRRINEIRSTLTSASGFLRSMRQRGEELTRLRELIDTGIGDLRRLSAGLDEARAIDRAYARGLLRIPSIEAPDIGPALFGGMVRARIEPALNLLDTIEEHVPPGLDPRRRPGPKRLRMAGSTVDFVRRESHPRFLLGYGECTLTLGSPGRPEQYLLTVTDLTTEPAILGRPATFTFERISGGAGDRVITASGVFDHTASPRRDSLEVSLTGAGMGEVALGSLNGRLDLGTGASSLSLVRSGEGFDATLRWECPGVEWESTGTRSGVESFIWETLTSMQRVTITAVLSSSGGGERFSVASNVSSELSRALRRQLGEEIERTEAGIRAEVDRRTAEYERAARAEVDGAIAGIEERISDLERRYEEARAELEARLKRITDRLPPGIIPPAPPVT